MTDWGCPNWRAICEYGEYENWSREQWRWEFKRRSQDIRMGFEMFAINEFKKDNPTKSVPKNLIWRPDYREVHFFCSPSKAASFGYSILRNPLYSKHEPLYLPPRKPHEDFQARTILPWHFWAVENSDLELFDVIGAGSLAISFNPDKTLAGTYLMDVWRLWPKILISSPTKRCGKSTFCEILEAHAHRPLIVSNCRAATLFRTIEMYGPNIHFGRSGHVFAGKPRDRRHSECGPHPPDRCCYASGWRQP